MARVFREHAGRAVATLARRFGDLSLAEEAVQEAFLAAASRWPAEGLPSSPVGWIFTTAHRAALDRVRREGRRPTREASAAREAAAPDATEDGGQPVPDDQLRLMFTCCHPALAPASQVALTLRLVAGLQTPEIARAFLVPEATLAQRLVRAKAKIREAHIPYRVPSPEELPERLQAVLAVVYLVFNEGTLASSGGAVDDPGLRAEALRLARLLVELLPGEPEALGLLALLLLVESRRAARLGPGGALVPLPEQDRTRWDRRLIAEGVVLVRRCQALQRPGPYQLQAAIQAVHATATRAADTDWPQVLALYEHLLALAPTPVVALNRAIALAETGPVDQALAAVEALAPRLEGYHLLHATRGELLQRLGRSAEAAGAYQRALALTANPAERALLARKLAAGPAG